MWPTPTFFVQFIFSRCSVKYDKRFRMGAYYLTQRGKAWYRTWLDGRVVRRASLNTDDHAQAIQLLTDWYVAQLRPVEAPQAAKLADVFLRYRARHSAVLTSAKRIKWSHDLWLAFHGNDVTVGVALKIERQEAFMAHLKEKYAAGTIKRTMTDGRSALNRAWRRGELTSQPNVLMPKVGKVQPKGRPLSVEELAKLYAASNANM